MVSKDWLDTIIISGKIAPTMSRDTILKGDDGVLYSYDNIRTQGWLDGHAPGIEQAANFLLERSKVLFASKKDDEALLLRALSEELKATLHETATERAKTHAKEYPDVIPSDDTLPL